MVELELSHKKWYLRIKRSITLLLYNILWKECFGKAKPHKILPFLTRVAKHRRPTVFAFMCKYNCKVNNKWCGFAFKLRMGEYSISDQMVFLNYISSRNLLEARFKLVLEVFQKMQIQFHFVTMQKKPHKSLALPIEMVWLHSHLCHIRCKASRGLRSEICLYQLCGCCIAKACISEWGKPLLLVSIKIQNQRKNQSLAQLRNIHKPFTM